MPHELCFGLGYATSSEKDPVNIADDAKLSPGFGINLAYRYHVTELMSLGLHMYGYQAKTPEYVVLDPQGNRRTVSFSLSSINFGVQGRYAFVRSTVMPYIFAVLNLAFGTIQEEQTGTLGYSGVSAGGGLGASVFLSDRIALSLEGVASFGSARWKQKPFLNSTGTDFNPVMIGVFVNFSYFM